MNVLVVGAGIGGLTLALELHQAGVPCRVLEAVPRLAPIGAGVNLLPHAVRVLERLGVAERLAAFGVETAESVFFNRFGQLCYREPLGRRAGYDHPQLSLHRGDAQLGLLAAVEERLGPDAVRLGRRVVAFDDDGERVTVTVEDAATGRRTTESATVVIACDGIHSAVRAQLYPEEGEPRYSGVTMWRGVTPWRPFLSGASMVRAGWLATGKMVIYPVREEINPAGDQLVNWVAEVERPRDATRDWTRAGRLEDFLDVFADWHFDWLDVPALIRGAESVLEYPMVDQDPLPRWTFGGVTLLGDAAHPMVPRGSNGAGQAILDAHALRLALAGHPGDPRRALAAYEEERRPATTRVVMTNRVHPPDTILKEVHDRTGDRPFERIEDVISHEEMAAISDHYKRVAAYDKDLVNRGG
ncbi:2-polyprenyl-6-methoxyphenol hydroxylase [Streptomyces zhaozhouensis]|uniref:2-polyprenyl-6-methoxyphenol hydroxylase n=1 Tax=Streptomyces zhaozhouensis TaxID=1300267 RepID=A0A286DXE9_9ACTN|nr:flavin-dependent oxidoreductase [Streptomyces zhaozhouensis]SOD63332.1 2-polyprenyl-6-methoxyphenol hydroxylase [Streptomyces zhaozhouensis]